MIHYEFATSIWQSDYPAFEEIRDELIADLPKELSPEKYSESSGNTHVASPADHKVRRLSLLRKQETHDQLQELNGSIGAALRCIQNCTTNLVRTIASNTHLPDSDLVRIASAWASFYSSGDYHSPHIHPNCHYSSVLMINRPPDRPPPERCLTIYDPRPNINYFTEPFGLFVDSERVIPLLPGQIPIFPAWLRHSVEPFYGTGERITLGANLVAARIERGRNASPFY